MCKSLIHIKKKFDRETLRFNGFFNINFRSENAAPKGERRCDCFNWSGTKTIFEFNLILSFQSKS